MFNTKDYEIFYNDLEHMRYNIKEILKHKNDYFQLSNPECAKATYDRLILEYPNATYYEIGDCQYICVSKRAVKKLRDYVIFSISSYFDMLSDLWTELKELEAVLQDMKKSEMV